MDHESPLQQHNTNRTASSQNAVEFVIHQLVPNGGFAHHKNTVELAVACYVILLTAIHVENNEMGLNYCQLRMIQWN